MASITIRNLDDEVKHALRMQAAQNGLSMEEQARQLLSDGVGRAQRKVAGKPRLNLAEFIDQAMKRAGGGVELEPFPRTAIDIERLQRRLAAQNHPKRS